MLSELDTYNFMSNMFKCENCTGMLHSSYYCTNCNKEYCGSCIVCLKFEGLDLIRYCKKCKSLYFENVLNFNHGKGPKKIDNLSKLWWYEFGLLFNSYFFNEGVVNSNEFLMKYSTEIHEILKIQSQVANTYQDLKNYLANREGRFVEEKKLVVEDESAKNLHSESVFVNGELAKKPVMTIMDQDLKIILYLSLKDKAFYISSFITESFLNRSNKAKFYYKGKSSNVQLKRLDVNLCDDTYTGKSGGKYESRKSREWKRALKGSIKKKSFDENFAVSDLPSDSNLR